MSSYKCEACGAPLNVDLGDMLSACIYCGMRKKLTFDVLDESDRYAVSGMTHIKMRSYAQALKAYRLLAEHCPQDYRGYYGMALAATAGFTCMTVDDSLATPVGVLEWLRYAYEFCPAAFKEAMKALGQAYETKVYEYDRLNAQVSSFGNNKCLDKMESDQLALAAEAEQLEVKIRSKKSSQSMTWILGICVTLYIAVICFDNREEMGYLWPPLCIFLGLVLLICGFIALYLHYAKVALSEELAENGAKQSTLKDAIKAEASKHDAAQKGLNALQSFPSLLPENNMLL